MLDSREEVISTLKSLNDYYYVKSNFIIHPELISLNIKDKGSSVAALKIYYNRLLL